MSERSERAREEFLSEAQEIVEQFNRDLLAIAAAPARPGTDTLPCDPEVLNDAFRAVHSLKGLAGLFGLARMSQLSHSLENLLDALRLGRLPLTQRVLDLLFEGVEHFHLFIAEIGAHESPAFVGAGAVLGADAGLASDEFIRRIEGWLQQSLAAAAGARRPQKAAPVVSARPAPAPRATPLPSPDSQETPDPFAGEEEREALRAPERPTAPPVAPSLMAEARGRDEGLDDYDLDPMLLAVLTEYEEHRLRENIREGRSLYRVLAAFPLLTIDLELEKLKGLLRPVGEVITYLPGSGGADPERIELEVMLGSGQPLTSIQQAAAPAGVEVRAVPRRQGASKAPSSVSVAPRAPREATPAPLPSPPGPGTSPSARTMQVPLGVEPPEFSATAYAGQAAGGYAASGAAGEPPSSLKSVSQTVRVDIRKLDHLMNIVGELSLVRSGLQSVQDTLRQSRQHAALARSLQDEVRMLSRKIDELQAGILEVRMVPLGQVFEKLSRVIRKLSREAGKEIRFVVSGAETELDKLIVEELSDPLMHVIRNAIDHGIEVTAVRRAAGKPEAGTVVVSAEQRGNHVVLEVEDDGAGIDVQALLKRGIARGNLTEEQARDLSLREIYNLMFLPGLSTREVADEISGRGVGMDVVKTNIARMSGIIDVASEPGQGTRLTITLPITLAIIQALVIRCAGRTYAIPLNSVMESLMLAHEQIRTIERREVISLRDQTLPLLRLEEVFALRRPAGQRPPALCYVVVVALAQHRLGLLVDELIGQQDIVIKSLGRALQGIPGIAGATELSGQQTALVLDVRALAEEALPRAVEAA